VTPDRRRRVLRAALADLQAGRFDAAAAALGTPDPADIEATMLAGLARAGRGDAAGGAPLLIRVAQARPEHAHPLHDLAALLRAAGRTEALAAAFAVALALTPDDPRLLHAWAEHLVQARREGEAIAPLRRALALRPGMPAARSLLGTLLAAGGGMAEALALFRQAVADDPGDAVGWSNLGKALAAAGDFPPAIEALDRAVRLAPQDAQLGLNRAIALLKSGRLEEGWAAYEVRLRMPGHVVLPPAQRLRGPPGRLDGRRVLVTHEEGFGDTLQFLRYVPRLAALGALVEAWVPPELVRIAGSVPGLQAAASTPPALLDLHIPCMSLPLLFGTSVATIPGDVPYLAPPPAEAASWAARLAHLPRPRVGLVWSGAARAAYLGAASVDRQRSLDPALLAPLAALPRVGFVSLQKGAREAPPLPLHDPMGAVRDFADTAAIIANLDAVVSVDTAVAHLAGALGRTVLLLDRYDNCWRWLSGRADSPWYPGLRIFRQDRPGEWEPVVARVAAALAEMRPAAH
jgi:tetratricopeptide (TPR) repeat protein